MADTEDNDTEMQLETIKIISDYQKTKYDNLNTINQMSSSIRNEKILVCKPNKRGLCVLHGIKIKKLSISSKKWVDRGGNKGYGWKTSKVPRYICEVKSKEEWSQELSDA